MKDLPKRALTAVIFGAVMLGGLFWSHISFFALILVINTGCLIEFLNLTSLFKKQEERRRVVSQFITLSISVSFLLMCLLIVFDVVDPYGLYLLFPMLLLLMSTEMILSKENQLVNGVLNVAAIIYITIPLASFFFLGEPKMIEDETLGWFPFYVSVPLGIVLLIWTNDTFAYFTGSLFGTHKILPSISPKKSWEGFFGGLIFSLITGWILSKYFLRLDLPHWLTVATLVVVFGTIGDFFESMIKRQAGVKDSGNLLPGHGGFLDRFDALLFCLPFVTLYLVLIS